MNSDKICRICFQKGSTLFNLFQLIAVDAEGNQVALHEMLSYCCSVKLSPHLSPLICSLCSDACTQAYNFIKLFRKNNDILINMETKPDEKAVVPMQFEEIKIEVVNDDDQEEVEGEKQFDENMDALQSSFENTQNTDQDDLENLDNQNLSMENKLHECPICLKIFKFYSSWSKHIKLHADKKFICQICKQKYENAEEFDKHYFKDHFNYCEFCQISFSMRKQFDYHRATLHKDWIKTRKFLRNRKEGESFSRRPERELKEHKCPTCKVTFNWTPQFLKHVKLAHANEVITCDKCNDSFSSADDYLFHYDRQHYSYCKICELSFNSRHSYIVHQSHHRERPCYASSKPHKCPYCVFHHGSFDDFLTHVKKSHKGSTSCEICDQRFDYVTAYVDHYFLDHRIRCADCNAYFTTQKLFDAHFNKNFSQKPSQNIKVEKQKKKMRSHICPICQQGVTRFRMFRKHIWEHTDTECDQTLKCSICDKSCMNANDFYKHYKSDHFIFCDKCALYYLNKQSFESHNCQPKEGRALKSKYNVCAICGKQYKGSLKYHEQTHQTDPNYECEICGDKFIGYDQFRYHRNKKHGRMKHLCTYCGRLFISKTGLNEHVTIHTKIKKYSCEKCGQLFTRPTSRKKHLTKGLCGKRKIYQNPKSAEDII